MRSWRDPETFAKNYECGLCGQVFPVPSLARDCENADMDDPTRVEKPVS
jgi:hypothetical protein